MMKKPRKRAHPTHLTTIGWNVRIVQKPEHVRAHLRKMIEAYNPKAFALFEAGHLHGHLGGLGYTVIHDVRGESADTALLIRDDFEIHGKEYLRMTLRWKGPLEGRMHPPRTYRWTRIDVHHTLWKFGGSHGPFGQKQKREYIARLKGWFASTKFGRPTVMLDDANIVEKVMAEHLANTGIDVTGDKHIDLAQYRNCKLNKKIQLSKYGSDHHAMYYEFEALK